MNPVKIQEVRRRSLAENYGIKAGDKLVSINGKKLRDIIDYELCAANEDICLDVIQNGSQRRINIKNTRLESLGVIFSTSLFDGVKRCANKCIFCFIDQLPPGMRKSVYIKDDDYRLSFLYGNFITLTNMKEQDIERIIKHRLSPIYVSLHTTNPELRAKMLGRKRKDRTYEYLKILLDAGIEIHIQMVLCPGINDGAELDKSIDELSTKYEGVSSIGLVPVGLTAYRDGLYPLRAFERQEIEDLIKQAKKWQSKFEKERGYALVYIADEFYISTGHNIPPLEHYGEFPQIENGIGLTRLFIDEVQSKLDSFDSVRYRHNIAIITGTLFKNVMGNLLGKIKERTGAKIDAVAVENAYFGGKVNVTGLITGSDIITSVKKKFLENGKPDVLVIPDIVLNGDGFMLDNYTPDMIASEIGVKVEVVRSTGAGFVEDMLEVLKKNDISLGGSCGKAKCRKVNASE